MVLVDKLTGHIPLTRTAYQIRSQLAETFSGGILGPKTI